jgi:hypothetical protein
LALSRRRRRPERTQGLYAQFNFGAAGSDVLNNMENITGSSFADSLTGNSVSNILIGGGGADSINLGNQGDDTLDIARFAAAGDYGDTISNFDADGGATQIDRVEFAGALNTLFDDGTNDDNFAFVTDDNVNDNKAAVNLNGTVEALFLDGANGEGVANASLLDALLVATEFNNEFAITAANAEATLLVINDTNGNSAAVWQWVQAGGGEISPAELTLVGIVNANVTISTGSFDFV